jgi:hypothetical protein
MLLEQLLQRDAHLLLDHTWVVHMSGDTEQLRALVPLSPEGCEPRSSTTADRRRHSDRLHVRHRGRASKQSHVRREWRLEPGLALLALNTLDQRSLLSTDIRSRSPVQVHIELVARPTGVLANVPGLVRFIDGLLHVRGLLEELATDVDVGGGGVHGTAGDETAFDELVGVATEDFTVLAGSGFTFVGVDDEVAGSGTSTGVLVQARNRQLRFKI